MRASYGSSNDIVAITQLAGTTSRSVNRQDLELDKTFEEARHAIDARGGLRARRGGA